MNLLEIVKWSAIVIVVGVALAWVLTKTLGGPKDGEL